MDLRSWIIPARAGFTASTSTTALASGDHPRSRGVYVALPANDRIRDGSSPLARGLRWASTTRRRPAWIIPARAGFTRRTHPWTTDRADHPRSRGVYIIVAASEGGAWGSSPLARGLHRRRVARDHGVRIIPARAGFTAAHCVCAVRARDHPRSRGVYGRPGRRARRVRGSSPLARGLLRAVRVLPEPKRIIPARAGFTVERRGQHLHQRDHPRSRGVYFTSEILFQEITGSSPLARGLRHERHRLPRGHGIIPARAGFTWPRRRCRAW